MNPIVRIVSKLVPVLRDNVDTDQIIPARFLKGTTKSGLGQHLFKEWRAEPGFPLDSPNMQDRSILLAGQNFGCGSSREHAPWALHDWGFRAVVARSFADIFRQNSLKNGLLPVVVPASVHAALCSLLERDPEVEVAIDLNDATLCAPSISVVQFPIDPFVQQMLLAGVDELGYLLGLSHRIERFESTQRALAPF